MIYTATPDNFDREFEVFLVDHDLHNKGKNNYLTIKDIESLRQYEEFVPESDIKQLIKGLNFVRDLNSHKENVEDIKESMTIYQTLAYFLSYIFPLC